MNIIVYMLIIDMKVRVQHQYYAPLSSALVLNQSMCLICTALTSDLPSWSQYSRMNGDLFRPFLVREGVDPGTLQVDFLVFKHGFGNIVPSERAISKNLAQYGPMRGLQWSV